MAFIAVLFAVLFLFGFLKGVWQILCAKARRTKRLHDEAIGATWAILGTGAFTQPTWHSNQSKRVQFLNLLQAEVLSSGFSPSKLTLIFAHPYTQRGALTAAHAFEERGFSFAAQVVGTSDFMKDALTRGLEKQILGGPRHAA